MISIGFPAWPRLWVDRSRFTASLNFSLRFTETIPRGLYCSCASALREMRISIENGRKSHENAKTRFYCRDIGCDHVRPGRALVFAGNASESGSEEERRSRGRGLHQ